MNTSNISQRRSTLLALRLLFVITTSFLSSLSLAGPFNPDFNLIFPQTPPIAGDAHIDGLKTGSDTKWTNAFDIQLIDGVPVADNRFLGVADNNFVYLYFETAVADFNNFDAVVIALAQFPDSSPRHLLVIYPCQNTAQCAGTVENISPDIDYYTSPAAGNTYTSTVAAHNVIAKAAVSESGGSGLWAVELKIPRGAPFNLPATGFFGMYAGVLDYDLFAGNVFQYTWPFNNPAGSTLLSGAIAAGSTDAIPLQINWGQVSLNASLPTGVTITSQDISTNHGSSVISINQPNVFNARARNYGAAIAQDVKANFQLANFGLPAFGSWENIGTSSVLDINPTAAQNYTLNWSVPPDRVDDYTAHDHQCIRVQLSSTDPATTFINNSAQRNMDFVVTSSPFTSKPTIATAGYKLSEGMRQEDFIIRERFYNTRPELKWESGLKGAEKIRDGLYHLGIPLKESKQIALAVQPPEKAFAPFKKLVIPAIKERESTVAKIAVVQGKIITLVPNKSPEDSSKKRITNRTDKPVALPNTILASWDGFRKTKFIVTPGMSLIAPKGMKALYVKQIVGEGERPSGMEQTLNVYLTNKLNLPRHLLTSDYQVQDKLGFVGFGVNLPTAIYSGYRNSSKTLKKDCQSFQVYSTAGSFGYVVKGRKADQ